MRSIPTPPPSMGDLDDSSPSLADPDDSLPAFPEPSFPEDDLEGLHNDLKAGNRQGLDARASTGLDGNDAKPSTIPGTISIKKLTQHPVVESQSGGESEAGKVTSSSSGSGTISTRSKSQSDSQPLPTNSRVSKHDSESAASQDHTNSQQPDQNLDLPPQLTLHSPQDRLLHLPELFLDDPNLSFLPYLPIK